ncbi:MAG: hypothetical protein WCS37_20810, partial [Chloroflexota bacterium]
KKQTKETALEEKKRTKELELAQKEQAKKAELAQKEQAKKTELAQKEQAKKTELAQKEQAKLVKIQQKALADQEKQQQKDLAEQEKQAKIQQKEAEKEARLREKEARERAKPTEEQKAQARQEQLEQKEREKELKAQQKEVEKEERLQRKEVEKEERLQRKETESLDKLERKEKEQLAQLGLLAVDGQKLTEEQEAKIEALRNLPQSGGSTAIFVAIALALLLVAGGLVLAFFIIPQEVSLGDLKAPEKSIRYDFNSDALDTIKKNFIKASGYDTKMAKRVNLDMLTATNPDSPDNIYKYFNDSMKEKGYNTSQPLAATTASSLTPPGVGSVKKSVFWAKKESKPIDPLPILILVQLDGNSKSVESINKQVQIINSPVGAAGTLLILARLELPQI